MRNTLVFVAIMLAVGCSSGRSERAGGPSTDDNQTAKGPDTTPNCNPNGKSNQDQDGDGYTPAEGDCNDCNPSINPGAVQVPGDPVDYACNGMPGVVPSCDGSLAGMSDAMSLAQAMDLCDSRFLVSAVMTGPSDARARRVESTYGVVIPRAGKSMSLVSNGIAADKTDPGFVEEDPGTNLGDSDTYANPLPNLPGAVGCSQTQPGDVNDYTELTLTLKAPTNVNSFSFDFEFFSAEYPVYVCTEYNDEFLVIQQSKAFATPTNIAFDNQHNAVTVNSGFFTVCTNDTTKAQTQHCTIPVTDIDGTGFEDPPLGGFNLGDLDIPGGATGWLTTTSPVTPGETFTLRFIVFDEGDHVLDSASLVDNFRWGTSVVSTPSTQPIQ